MPRFDCPRCGASSSHPGDIRAGYCASCRDWTGTDLPGECALTARVLLTDDRWSLETLDGEHAVFAFDPLAGPWLRSWRPDVSLGAFTASWCHGAVLMIEVGRQLVERAAYELSGELPGHRLMRCPSLMGVLGSMRAREDRYQAEIARTVPIAVMETTAAGLYRCLSCLTEFEVPPDRHSGPVLCGQHSPPAIMTRAGSQDWPPGSIGEAEQWSETEALTLYAEATAGPEAESCIAAAAEQWGCSLAGLAVGIEMLLTDEQAAELERQIRAVYLPGSQPADGTASAARESAAAVARPARRENQRTRRLRSRQLVDDAEALIARLDGEGYGVRDKAVCADLAYPATRPAERGADDGAMSWQPGDPAL